MATGPKPISTYSNSSTESEGSFSSNGHDGDSDSDRNCDSEPEAVRDTHRCHRLKFKGIGSKKEQRYQDALRSAQDVRWLGHTIVQRTSEP